MKTILCIFVMIEVVEVAMVINTENGKLKEQLHYKSQILDNDEDLTYSDLEILIESREPRYRQIRAYGVVSSDVAQMHMPPGITIGELLRQEKETDESDKELKNDDNHDKPSPIFDPWRIVWYICTFGGLIALFLVLSCSEWCCLKKCAALQAAEAEQRRHQVPPAANQTRETCETPPPAYHLFAPPPYEDLVYSEQRDRIDVFIVPVHACKCVPVSFDG